MKRGLLIDPLDNVGIVVDHVEPGEQIRIGDTVVTVVDAVDLPHKIALRDIAPGEHVLKYGAVIGYATQPIRAGQHVHVHNVDSEKLMK